MEYSQRFVAASFILSLLAWLFPGATPTAGQPPTGKDSQKLIAELRAKIDKLSQRTDMVLEREEAIFALINALREAPPLTRLEENAILARILEETIETKGLQEKVKLKTALEYFSDKFGGRIPILIDRSAFAAIAGPNDPDPYEEEVSLPPVPAKMPMSLALRIVLAQVSHGEATFFVRQGFIEITTVKAGAAVNYLSPIHSSHDHSSPCKMFSTNCLMTLASLSILIKGWRKAKALKAPISKHDARRCVGHCHRDGRVEIRRPGAQRLRDDSGASRHPTQGGKGTRIAAKGNLAKADTERETTLTRQLRICTKTQPPKEL